MINNNTIAKWTQYIVVPEDVYEAVIVDFKVVDNPFKEGENQFKFTFKLETEGNEEVSVLKSMSPKLNEKSTFYALCSAVMNERPTKTKYPDGILGTELIGKKVRVSIKHKTGDNGNTYMRAESFLPSKK